VGTEKNEDSNNYQRKNNIYLGDLLFIVDMHRTAELKS
jgi:hypothetical protein